MAFHHCVHGKSWLWLFLLGPAPFAFCFVSLLDGEAHIWLGDLRFALCGLCFLFVLLICHMTTGVYVDVILNCFFSCKDRASERDRPYRRKKNSVRGHAKVRTHTVHEETLLHQFFLPKCYFCLQFARKKIWKFSTQSKKQLAKMQQKKNVQWVVLMTEVPFPKPAIDALQGSAKPAGRGHASDAKRVGTEQRHAATLKLEVFGNCPQLRKDWKLQKIKIIETKFKAGVNGSLKLQCLFEALYLKPNLQGGTRFNWLRVHFWTPVQRKRVSKKGSLDCVLVLCQIFFSVQRLHGFRQVVQHVQLHVAN